MHYISINILSKLTNTKITKIRKLYKEIIINDLIELKYLDDVTIDKYLKNVLLLDDYIDLNLYELIPKSDYFSINSNKIQNHFKEIDMLKTYQLIHITYSFSKSITTVLKEFSKQNNLSLRTLERKYKLAMNNTDLNKLLLSKDEIDFLSDNHYSCCLLAKTYIISRHLHVSKLTNGRIYNDLLKQKDFLCTNCPYRKGYVTTRTLKTLMCKRNSETIIVPRTRYVVDDIIRRIPDQEVALAIEGEKVWASKYRHTAYRNKPDKVNEVWIADNHKFDIEVITHINKDNTFETSRIWICGIIDGTSNALIGYAIGTSPNANMIAETFARAATFKLDNDYYGLPKVFYIDNGKDYRANKLKGLTKDEQSQIIKFNKDFINSGILEYFNVRVINALPYRGCSKVIEGVWKIIEENYIKGMPGYIGNSIRNGPPNVDRDIKEGKLYTFEQFVDIFADTIYEEYNHLVSKETGLSPDDIYLSKTKVNNFVPSWRTLSVLRGKKETRDIKQKHISYDNKRYWHAGLAPYIGKTNKVDILAFDSPYNRTISLFVNKKYIGEGHLIEKLDMVEKEIIKVKLHLKEQENQYKTISNHIEELNEKILASDILSKDNKIPAIINRFYCQTRDKKKDKEEAFDDKSIPEEVKGIAVKYLENSLADEVIEEDSIFNKQLKKLGQENE